MHIHERFTVYVVNTWFCFTAATFLEKKPFPKVTYHTQRTLIKKIQINPTSIITV